MSSQRYTRKFKDEAARRFDNLGTAIFQRLEQASTTELQQWAENILNDRTLDEVFTRH